LGLKSTIFREEATSALGGFHGGPLSYLVMLVFGERGKLESPEKNPLGQDENQQQNQPKYLMALGRN